MEKTANYSKGTIEVKPGKFLRSESLPKKFPILLDILVLNSDGYEVDGRLEVLTKVNGNDVTTTTSKIPCSPIRKITTATYAAASLDIEISTYKNTCRKGLEYMEGIKIPVAKKGDKHFKEYNFYHRFLRKSGLSP